MIEKNNELLKSLNNIIINNKVSINNKKTLKIFLYTRDDKNIEYGETLPKDVSQFICYKVEILEDGEMICMQEFIDNEGDDYD